MQTSSAAVQQVHSKKRVWGLYSGAVCIQTVVHRLQRGFVWLIFKVEENFW